MRQVVLTEEPLCRICKAQGIIKPSVQVDHIQPISKGGTDLRDNLQGICLECHIDKTAQENGTIPIGIDGYPVKHGTGGI